MINNIELPASIQSIIRAAATILYLRRDGWKSEKALREIDKATLESGFLQAWLESVMTLSPLEYTPIPALQEITRLSTAVTELETLFISSRLECAVSLLPVPQLIQVDGSPSATELCRIRRAIWRYILYWSLFGCIDGDDRGQGIGVNYSGPRTDIFNFWRHLQLWEAEEIECVYLFLEAQQNESQISDQTRSTLSCILQLEDLRFHKGFGPIDVNETVVTKHNFLKELYYTREFNISEYQNILSCIDCPDTDHPNAAWQYIRRSRWRRDPTGSRYSPWKHLQSWGYCIWDVDRLSRWNFKSYIDSLDEECWPQRTLSD